MKKTRIELSVFNSLLPRKQDAKERTLGYVNPGASKMKNLLTINVKQLNYSKQSCTSQTFAPKLTKK